MKKILIGSMVIFTGLQGCKKEEGDTLKDTERPVISLTAPGDGSFKGGEKIPVRGVITDNQNLGQVKIEIHSAFDGHSHQKKAGAEAFAWDSIINISGKSYAMDFAVDLPEDIASGTYHFIVHALDAEGNESEFTERELELRNGLDDEAPSWQSLTWTPAPDAHGHIELTIAENVLSFSGIATDNLDLEEAELIVEEESSGKIVYEKDEHVHGTSEPVSMSVTFQPAWESGEYHVTLILKDAKGNTTTKEVHVEFSK